MKMNSLYIDGYNKLPPIILVPFNIEGCGMNN